MSAHLLLVSIGGPSTDRISSPLLSRQHDLQQVNSVAAAARLPEGHDLVIVDTATSAASIDACRKLRTRLGSDVPILAIAASDAIEDRIALLEAGADDVLGPRFGGGELEAIVDALLARSQPAVDGIEPRPLGSPRRRAASGRLIVFSAAKGGSGTTTLAVNTAVLIAEGRASVAIVDLDMRHGQVATHLDVAAPVSTAQLAREEETAEGSSLIRDAATRHASGVTVFAAPGRPDEAAQVAVDDAVRLVRALRHQYAIVVVDAGSSIDAPAMALTAIADQAVMVVTPDIPALRAVQSALEAMAEAGVLGEQMRYLMNQPHAHGNIEQADIERHLGVSVALNVPHDGVSCMRAVNEGQPVVLQAPRAAFSEALRRVTSSLVDEQPAAKPSGSDEPESRRRLPGLFRRTRGSTGT